METGLECKEDTSGVEKSAAKLETSQINVHQRYNYLV